MFRFESIIYLKYLFLLPVGWVVLLLFYNRKNEKLRSVFGNRLYPFLTASVSSKKRKWKIFLQLMCLAFLLIALARPQSGQSKQEIKSEGIEIIFLADVSESMLADDVRPSRLTQAKIDMSKLVENLSGNKIGLVAFAGSAVLLSPLTTDPSSLKLFIDSLNTNSVSTQGTSFKEALQEAKSGFERGGEDADEAHPINKVVLIFSDGEDQEKGALDLVKKMTDEGVRIFTVAYGTEKGGPIPERDSLGYLRGYKKDHRGQTILTTVHGEALQQLAQLGGGSFFFASPGGNYLKLLQEDINKVEKTQFESKMAMQYDEKFQIALVFAFIFGLIELFLGERRSAFRLWSGRFEVPQA